MAALAFVGLSVAFGATAATADPTYSISGTVSDTTGTGIASLGVVLDDSNNNVVGSGSTDPNGNYSFPALDPGNYTLLTTASTGYVATHSAVTVTADDVVLNVSTALIGSIAGTVTAGGTAVSGVRIAAFDSSTGDEFDAGAPTDAGGAYSITLPATNGGYTFYFTNASGAHLAIVSYDFGGGALDANNACRLDSGGGNVAPLAAGSAIDLTVVLNPNPATCGTTGGASAAPPHHKPAVEPQSTTVATPVPSPVAAAAPSHTPNASKQKTSIAKTGAAGPALFPASSTGPMPMWGWLLVILAFLLIFGGVGFTVVHHR